METTSTKLLGCKQRFEVTQVDPVHGVGLPEFGYDAIGQGEILVQQQKRIRGTGSSLA